MSTSFHFNLYAPPVEPPAEPVDPSVLLELLGERFRDAAIALLPPGEALSKEPDSKLGVLLFALMLEYARVQLGIDALRMSTPPSVYSQYLDEWEEALGLPGSCVAVEPTTSAERAGAIIAKLRGRRSRNQSAYEAAAAALGYPELEFEHFPIPTADSLSAGDPVYSDEWAYTVRVHVTVGDQTADDALICLFTDQLRRAHAFLDIIMEGPMGAERKHYENYFNLHTMSASFEGAAFDLRYAGHVSIVAHISNGAAAAPTDTPVGAWELQVSGDGVAWVTDTDTAITTPLAVINPNGNNLVNKVAKLTNVGSRYGRLRYAYTSGGLSNAKATAHVTTW